MADEMDIFPTRSSTAIVGQFLHPGNRVESGIDYFCPIAYLSAVCTPLNPFPLAHAGDFQ